MFKELGVEDKLIVSLSLGDDQFAIFKSGTNFDTTKASQIMAKLGLISKIKLHKHMIQGDFLNNVFVPAVKWEV